MYIVTLEEFDARSHQWYKTYRKFGSKETARGFLECMYESPDTVRCIKIWEAEEVKHSCELTAQVTFDEE